MNSAVFTAREKAPSAPCLALYCRKNRQGRSRLGITVGVKVGKAVCRNRTRRRIREAYRLHEEQFLPGYDLVVVARVRARRAPLPGRSSAACSSWRTKLGLLQKEARS